MKIKIKGVKAIENKLKTRLRRTKNSREEIFETALKPILKEIRSNLLRDTINSKDGEPLDHTFTGGLLQNTRYEAGLIKNSGEFDFEYVIKLGYFVPYGLDLEIGSNPKDIFLSVMTAWSRNKYSKGRPWINPKALAERISEEGTRAYPIIRPVFNSGYDDYYNKVLAKVQRKWG